MSSHESNEVAALVRPAWKRYAFAVVCIAAAAIMRWISNRWLDGAYPVLPPLLAILASAWYGGFGPAMLATVAGPFIVILLPEQPGAPVKIPPATLLVYFGFSVGIALLGGHTARARQRIYQQIDELARQREQLTATLHSIGDAVIVTDASGHIASMNPIAETITGWASSAAAGIPLEEVFRIIHQDTRAQVESPVQRVLREGQIVGLANHTLLIAKDGRERPIDDSGAPIHDATGKLAGVVLVFRDVTERRQSELQLKEEARKKDEFLALLAHELRNPLAPIRSALDVLKLAGDDPEAAAEARDVAERQLRQMTRLVDDLLDVSRIMRGKVELRKECIDVAVAVARAVETARPIIEADQQELTVSLPDEPVWVEADLVRLSQILANLLSNAAKYTEPGGSIHLSAAVENEQAVVRINDNGIGIDPAMLPRVFEMFMQAAPGASRSQGGLGIGLTLVKNLVEMHGGSVEAYSQGLGKGSQFAVRLPLASRAVEATVTAPMHHHYSPKRRILVVDDNVDAAQSLALLLRIRGHEVMVAFRGEEALSCVRASQPQIVLMDIGMPGMNGYEVARRLRAEFDPSLKLIALTGWGTDQDRQRSRDAGFDCHLTKPVDLGQLESVLTKDDAALSGVGGDATRPSELRAPF